MAYFHCRRRIWIPNPIVTLYYAEIFPLVWIWIWIAIQMVSQMLTVPILGMDLHPRDRSPSQFYYISIRVRIQTSGKILHSTGIRILVRIRLRQRK